MDHEHVPVPPDNNVRTALGFKCDAENEDEDDDGDDNEEGVVSMTKACRVAKTTRC